MPALHSRVLQELLTHRTWDVSRHPQWLVFEVEGRLQIRPNQHVLAQTLLAGGPDGRGPIAQLNMGEGKTRVVLPMMILELADGHNLVRSSANTLQACPHALLHKLVLSTFPDIQPSSSPPTVPASQQP